MPDRVATLEAPSTQSGGDREAEPTADREPVQDRETIVFAPGEGASRIDLRSPAEPWKRRRDVGRAMRAGASFEALAATSPQADRPDPVALIEASNAGRQERLIPLRIVRMAQSPFAFLRGAATVMAWDLAQAPRSGIDVVLDGDAHIANFGLFGSPQGEMILDLNDFDEVTIGPWEWDLKRLAAGICVGTRDEGLGKGERGRALRACVAGYRVAMNDFAPEGPLNVWRRAARAEELRFKGIDIDPESQSVIRKAVQKARKNGNASLLTQVGGRQNGESWRFKDDPPVLTAVDEATREAVISGLERYAESLPQERRFMLSRYHVVDVAHRVVGVGSVGTRAYVALLFGTSDEDALFLQVKEAVVPALAPYVPPMPEPYRSHEGQRVVYGQRLLQAVGDPLLGWTTIDERPFYVRQMKNMKGGVPLELLSGRPLVFFAWAYGSLLARAHARTGDAAAIAGYCGKSDATGFDAAIAAWAEAYAGQTERDHRALKAAIAEGRLTAAPNP